MIYKFRTKPVALSVMESLLIRLGLSKTERKYYLNQKKGYEGELVFDTYLKKWVIKCLVLNDLCLKVNGSVFQIDTLIICGDTIYIYELKNYSGNYDYKDGALQARSDFEILNPLNRNNDRKILLNTLLRKLGYRFKIEAFVVFMNPEFYLYDLPRDKPFLFVGQLPQHFKMLEEKFDGINASHQNLAQKFCDLHIKNYRPHNLPEYHYSGLTKGIYCPQCFSFEHADTRQNRICKKCGYKETIVEAIRRSAEECRLLFPNEPLGTPRTFEWCGQIYNKPRIRRVLKKSGAVHFLGPKSYYHFD